MLLTVITSICFLLSPSNGAHSQASTTVQLRSFWEDVRRTFVECSHRRGLQELLSPQEPIGDFGSIKIDEYGDIDPTEERARLDDFAKQLKAQPNDQAYIIAYAGKRSWRGEAEYRASCARNYLVTKQRIDKGRIVIVDGGFQNKLTVSLYIKLPDAKPPLAFPTVDPRKVEIVKNHRSRKRSGPCRHANKRRPL